MYPSPTETLDPKMVAMVGIQYPMRAHLWTHGSSGRPALHTSHDFIPTSSCKDRDARRQTPGSRLPEKRRAIPRPPAFELAAVKGRASRSSPARPARWPSDCIELDSTGPGWIGLLSQTGLAQREKAPSAPTHHDRPAKVSREHRLSFSNQPSLDSLAREEKPTPTPPTQQQPRNACTHARARMLPQTSSESSLEPDALALTRQPVRPPPPPPPRRIGIFCRQNLSLSRLFLNRPSENAGLLADSLTPIMRTH